MKRAQYVIARGLVLGALGPFAWTACTGSSSTAPPGLPEASPGDDATTEPDATPGDDVTPDASDASSTADAMSTTASDGASTSDAASPIEAAVDAAPDIDAGAGCISPGNEATLSAADEGLPADGLVLWVRADRGVYKTASDDVCAWRDQTSNGRLLAPSSPSVRPSWGTTSVGGQPAIHFAVQGTDLSTGGVLGMGATDARTFVAVEQLVSTTGRFHPILQGESGSPAVYLGIDANTWETAGSREGAYAPGGAFDTMLATASVPRVHVMTVSTLAQGTDATSAIDYRINGATQTLTLTSGSSSLGDFSTANFTTIGSVSLTTTTVYGDAMVAEALIYDRALSLAEKQAAESALETRYGIQ